MLKKVLLMLVVVGVAVGAGSTQEYAVVSFGRVDMTPLLGPLKWSPNSDKLAFMRSTKLMISDTLGNVDEVKELTPRPHSFEWLSNNEMVLHQRAFVAHDTGYSVLSIIDVRTGQQTVLDESKQKLFSRQDLNGKSFAGPRLTIEGSVYYYVRQGDSERVILPESLISGSGKDLSPETGNTVEWKAGGLYLIKADRSDSTKIADRPFTHITSTPMMSPDRSFVVSGGLLFRVADGSLIVLDTLVKEFPPGTDGCGFVYPSFVHGSTELLFDLTCDDGHSYVVDRIGLFNYETYKFTVLDSLVGVANCKAPASSPDGRRIAFIANRQGYIIVREEL